MAGSTRALEIASVTMSRAAVSVIVMAIFVAPRSFASGEASEVTPIVGAGISRGTALGSPWAPHESYSLSLLGLWEAGQGIGARITLLPSSTSAGAWELSADALARFANDGPLYFKGIGGIAASPNSVWPPRVRAGGEAGLHAIRGSIGLEAGIAGVYSFPPSRFTKGEVVVSLGVGILFGFGAPSRAPAIAHLKSSLTEPRARNPGGSALEVLPTSSQGSAAGWHSSRMGERDVVQQILLLQKPGDVVSWWASGPGEGVERWTHPLSEWEQRYVEAMGSLTVPEPIRMWPPVAPERLTPEQADEARRLLGSGVTAAQEYSNWENRRRIVKHYIVTHPATVQLSLGLYGLARDSNPLFFALERGWQMASGKEMFTAQEVSRLGAAAEVFTVLASGVAAGKLMSATRPVAGRSVQAPVDPVERAQTPRPSGSPAARPLSSVEEQPLAATGTDGSSAMSQPMRSGERAGGSGHSRTRAAVQGAPASSEQPPKIDLRIEISKKRFGAAAQHWEEAQKAGHPRFLTIERTGAKSRRGAALQGLEKQAPLDLDEYPPAMFSEGGNGADVRAISMGENRALGAYVGQQCMKLPNGAVVEIHITE